MRIARMGAGFVLAVIVTTVLGSIAHTQFVLAGLIGLGIEITVSDRLSTTLQDIAGMGPMFGMIVAIAFLIAMPAATLVYRFAGMLRYLVYGVAGAVALGVALAAMGIVFDITPIAGARTMTGFIAQMIAGALGGLTFARVTR
ncbi:hypothetical protein [Parvibaculum sp.]|jgi:hypothetical protein|uniref:hypothetical protein n=1 Tax=Parvibaculum sp. TaxID=2024848 RepID=UPI0025E1B29B|nr:hypothetical protein [Parvibaculum sp.]